MENKNYIFSHRLIISVLWNIAMQILLAILLVCLIQIDLLHPMLWISSTIEDIFSWKMLFNIVLLGLVSFFQAYIYGSYYMTPMPKYFTRFSMFMNIFSVQNFILSILYALSGYFTMSLYSSLAKSNFNMLKKKCETYDGQCLVESSLFLQFGGMWMGLYYFLNVHVFNVSTLVFSHIYQDKFQQIKLAINNILSLGFKNSIPPVAYYCLFYYVWGNKPRSAVSEVYSSYLEDPPLDNIYNLLRSGIWIGLWLYTSLFFVSIYIMKSTFNIILTEPMNFPVESNTHMTIYDAMAQRSQFCGYLGAQDLKIMSLSDPVRRLQIFTLSQPGGHPRNWNNVLDQCLQIINDFSHQLDNISHEKQPELEVSPQNATSRSETFAGLRNMAHSPELLLLKNHNKPPAEDTFANVVKEECKNLLKKICQLPGISYFFGELTDTKLKYLLVQAQPVVWACEGLAFMAAASLKEDKYGVVQNDLSKVITALINLKQNLEKLTKPGLISRKHALNDDYAIKMRAALFSSVKRSIYKLVITFSKYMQEIPLDRDVQLAIQPYLLLKEA